LWYWDGSLWTWIGGSDTVNQSGIYGTQGTAATGNLPGARFIPRGWIDSSDNLWLFGGGGYDSAGVSDRLNDLWRYQP